MSAVEDANSPERRVGSLPILLTLFLCACGPSKLEKLEGELKAAVLNELTDPGSAQFKNLRLIEKGPEGKPVLCGEVNAKNKMGGYVGFTRFAAQQGDGGVCEPVMRNASLDAALCDEQMKRRGCAPENK